MSADKSVSMGCPILDTPASMLQSEIQIRVIEPKLRLENGRLMTLQIIQKYRVRLSAAED